jgi:hypothetical protein
MEIKQISVFIENTAGRLAEVANVLAKAGVNMRALSIADTADFGILRIVADNAPKAVDALHAAGFTTRLTDVTPVEIPDTPGGLALILDAFNKAGLNIEYLYASLSQATGKAVVIFKLADAKKGMEIITANGWKIAEEF